MDPTAACGTERESPRLETDALSVLIEDSLDVSRNHSPGREPSAVKTSNQTRQSKLNGIHVHIVPFVSNISHGIMGRSFLEVFDPFGEARRIEIREVLLVCFWHICSLS